MAIDWALVFAASNGLALLGWAVLILAPRGRWAWLDALPRLVIPLVLAFSYGVLAFTQIGRVQGGGFGSIPAVRALFAVDPVLLAGWQHYLAFDLLVGGFAAGRLDQARVHRALQAFLLGTIFMLGPLGFLLSMATEAVAARLPMRREVPAR